MKAIKISALTKEVLYRFAGMSWWWQLLFVSILSLALYAPVLNNSFVSDDFFVIKKVCLDRQLNADGFFRPLSDITLYLNYLISGLNPAGFYLANILLHALNTLLLFHFCRLWKWAESDSVQLLYACIAGMLFLTYPFHSEPIVWILGRASLSAATFGMLALVIMVGNWHEGRKLAGVAVCYFIGMTGYESVMVMPAMVFIWLLSQPYSRRRFLLWMGIISAVFLVHILLRILIAGSILGDYGREMIQPGLADYLIKTAKVTGRLFLPPMKNAAVLSVLFLLLVALLGFFVFKLWKQVQSSNKRKLFFFQLTSLLITALLVPFMFGISTNTSESDRFLYFPSFFLCSFLAFGLVNLFNHLRPLLLMVLMIVVYNIVFVELNNRNWQKASTAVTDVLGIIKDYSDTGIVYIINMPEEIDGAFVFRVGFREALLLNGLDTSAVKLVNQVEREELTSFPGKILHIQEGNRVFIPPSTYISRNAAVSGTTHVDSHNPDIIMVYPEDMAVYWNKKEWMKLNP